MWCTQHLERNDIEQIKKHCSNDPNRRRIMADIYGTQNEVHLQDGLADSFDEKDFDARFESLKSIWEDMAPGFHQWFEKNRCKVFKDCLIMSARTRHEITQRFTTNGLEAKHRLQKKVLREDRVKKEVVSVSERLSGWAASYYTEARKAIRGIGKYRLSTAYQHFFVEPAMWVQWSEERRNQHFQAYMDGAASNFAFTKPSSAGRKPDSSGKNQRRSRLPEPEVFSDRIERSEDDSVVLSAPATVLPLRIKRTNDVNDEWQVHTLFRLLFVSSSNLLLTFKG